MGVKLVPVKDDELELLWQMQIESFLPLYEKYRDAGSPAAESLERVRMRAAIPGRTYCFIVVDGERAGAVNIGTGNGGDTDPHRYHISPLFVLPAFQNRGIAQAAIREAFRMFPEARVWRLSTILEEAGNCHLYEKCGFVRTGEPSPINERMTLVEYQKIQDPD